ncbi:ATP-binding protein [Candidatus Thiosymbion oneisti]|uniref:ATP-binding protein n=1 Tax=Candidatus Thiosymbion oneisti TaxID=589554 RepID=UPI000B7D0C86|nr:ATP-binding protein [Candidatus Thiosymbion oneisti]
MEQDRGTIRSEAFLDYREYHHSLTKVEQGLDGLERAEDRHTAVEDLLPHYIDLLTQRKHAFPLLLQDGLALQLPREPSHLYLLPPLQGHNEGTRLALCLYAARQGEPADVALVAWEIADEGASVTRLAHNLPESLPEDCRLDERALEIVVEGTRGGMYSVYLEFRGGKLHLQLRAYSNEPPVAGIVSIHWEGDNTSKSRDNFRRQERYSHGNMEDLLWLERHLDDQWRDDGIVLTKDSTDPDIPAELGRIAGVDSPQEPKDLAYLGGDQAQVFRIHLGSKTGKLVASERLGGRIHDVLVVSDPDPDKEGTYGILVAAYNSSIYLLEDGDGQGDQLRVRHGQTILGHHIERMAGYGGDRILAIDQYRQLIPLRLGSPRRFKAVRDRATGLLFRQLGLEQSDHPLWTDPLTVEDPDKRRSLSILALERYLLSLSRDERRDLGLFEDFFGWFKHRYELRDAELGYDLGRIQVELFTHLREAFRAGSVFADRPSDRKRDLTRFDPLWALLRLPDAAPDWLWIALFRTYDWLPAWAKYRGFDRQEGFQTPLGELLDRIRHMRSILLPHMHELRPLTVRGSAHFRGQIRHLRQLDENRFVLFEHGFGLRLVEIPSDPTRDWPCPAELKQEGDHWDGIPTTLLAGERLGKALGDPSGQYLFLGTHRGDLRLYRLHAETRPEELWRGKAQFAVTCSGIAGADKTWGLVLGGESPREQPILGWLRLHPNLTQGQPAAKIWERDKRGSLRMLVVDQDNRLWGVDREARILVHWPDFGTAVARGGKIGLQDPKIWLKSEVPLHALRLAEEEVLLCARHDGMAVALNATGGALSWTAGCGASLRHVGYLGANRDTEPGLWVLGGDPTHLLLVDEQGQLSGIGDGMGPVSALRRLGDHRILVGTSDGRVILLDHCRPEAGSEDGQTSGFDRPGALSTHPLRYRFPDDRPDSEAVRKALVKEARYQDPDWPETLAAFALLRQAKQALSMTDQPESSMNALMSALEGFFEHQRPRRLALFLRHPEPIPLPRVLRLIEIAWENISRRPRETLVCHLVTVILIRLEEAVLAPDTPKAEREKARALLDRVHRCLWERSLPSDCPQVLIHPENRERLRLLRLTQGVRCWVDIGKELDQKSLHGHGHLTAWCRRLATLWSLHSAEELARRLRLILMTGLVLEGNRTDHWLAWLRKEVVKEQPLKEWQPPPEPLCSLEPPDEDWQLTKLSLASFEALVDLWPEDEEWRSWLSELQTCLGAIVDDRQRTGVKEAWRERGSIDQLHEHLATHGAETFSVVQGYGLLPLYWPRLLGQWQGWKDKRLDTLEREAQAAENQSLDIDWSDRWLDRQRVELRLAIRNRHPVPVRLDRVCWENRQRMADAKQTADVKTEPELPIEIDASEMPASLEVRLEADENDRLVGNLTLACCPKGGKEFERSQGFDCSRDVAGFFAGLAWSPTGEHLTNLLNRSGEAGGPKFLWLDGGRWTDEERRELAQLMQDRFGGPSEAGYERIENIEQALDRPEPVFCPDLALGDPPEGALLEQVHGMLHAHKTGGFLPLAFAIWQRRGIPQKVSAALRNLLPDPESVDDLLRRLLADQVGRFDRELTELPIEALGAWCYGEPVYADPRILEEVTTQGGRRRGLTELYSPSAGLLGDEVWDRLAGLDDSRIAELLGIDTETATRQRQRRQRLAALWSEGAEARDRGEVEQAAQTLLGMLGGGTVSLVSRGCWYVQTRITLHHQDYAYVYLLMKISARERQCLKEQEAGVWLCLDHSPPAADLTGPGIRIDREDCLRLIHSDIPGQMCESRQGFTPALAYLNQLAAAQRNISPERVFRTSGGLPPDAIPKHFAGRDRELAHLWRCLEVADQGGTACALIVGARLIGKTTLRQRMVWEVAQQQKERRVIDISFEDIPPNYEGITLEHWVFKKLWEKLGEIGEYRHQPWDRAGDERKRQEARDYLAERLRKIKDRTGHSLLLFFDETNDLVQRDWPDYSLFKYLRHLVQEEPICLFATTYPHGWGPNRTLHELNGDETSSLGNLFGEPLQLAPWSPEEAWRFLHDKLAGFGVVMPHHLRRAVLTVSRGIPWIIHWIALHFCDQGTGGRRLVRRKDWLAIRDELSQMIQERLYTPVNSSATKYDTARLGNDRLWRALSTIAARSPVEDPPNNWCREWEFSLEEVWEELNHKPGKEVVGKALHGLTYTEVIKGYKQAGQRFGFTANLFPAWTQYQQRGPK